MIDRLEIQDSEYHKIRVGPLRDGGYVLPKEPLNDVDLIMVFGVSDDVDFELDFLEKYPSTQIYLYDHTIDALPKNHQNFNYRKMGIGARKDGDLNSLIGFLEEVDPHNQFKKMLKIDIEFNEWEVIEAVPLQITSQFELIVIELHLAFVEYSGKHSPYFISFFKSIYGKINIDLANKYISSIEKLKKTHSILHAHVNNSLPSLEIDLGGGTERIPQLVELTLLRKDLVKKSSKSNIFTPLNGIDFPNKSDRPDFDLSGNIIP